MGEFKHALGFVEVPPEPEPVLAPVAKAQANASVVLVGVPVRFTSEGTRDPAGLALAFSWDFGDGGGAAEGPVALRSFEQPGEYVVTLRVVNSGGVSDSDVVTVAVERANRAPVASFLVMEGGRNVTTSEAGKSLSFDATPSYDQDGDALSYLWDFGDGASSFEATPEHAYAAAGLYTVRLKVDDGVRSSEASRLVAVNATLRVEGAFRVQGAPTQTHALGVPEELRQVDVELRFPAGFGANDLRLVVRDAEGVEVARLSGETPPASQEEQVRATRIAGDALREFAAGAWEFTVERAQGTEIQYVLVVRETY